MLSTHEAVKKITLIGSIPTGRAIMRAGARTLKHVLFELDGKNAMIVYPDADIDKAVVSAVQGMNFAFAGQSCS
jgi:betaine-aldehyde dehydrogenase